MDLAALSTALVEAACVICNWFGGACVGLGCDSGLPGWAQTVLGAAGAAVATAAAATTLPARLTYDGLGEAYDAYESWPGLQRDSRSDRTRGPRSGSQEGVSSEEAAYYYDPSTGEVLTTGSNTEYMRKTSDRP